MSESNEAFGYFNSGSSDKSRVEKANFDVLHKVDFVSHALDLNACTDSRRSEPGVNNSNHVSPEEKKDDNRRQMVNLPKLLNQLVNARVVLERLSISTRADNLERTDSLTYDNSASNKLSTTGKRQSVVNLIKRYCSECKITDADVSVSNTESCAKCGNPLDFQCARCDKLYNGYSGLLYHLHSICNRQNLDLKCSNCDYRTHVKKLMSMHKTHCLTKKRSNLHAHMREEHKDNNIKAYGDLVAIGDTSDIADDKEKENILITTIERQKHADLVRRFCSKCKLTVPNASTSTAQLCAKCGTLLDFQCVRCDKLYSVYERLWYHFNSICNRQNLDLKCSNCDYRTHVKKLMNGHLRRCTSAIIYSCNHCKFTTKYKSNLHEHRQKHHKDSVAIGDTSDVADDKEKENMLITTGERQKTADLVRRYCSKCKLTVADVCVSTTKLCAKCGTLLDYQCVRCEKLYSVYKSLTYHLDTMCNRQSLDLKCSNCDYRTQVKKLMTAHLNKCTSVIITYSCSLCMFTTKYRSNFYVHMQRRHKDTCHIAACSNCRGKPNKCFQCRNTGLICENCHVGFGSNDRLLEHYESCKK